MPDCSVYLTIFHHDNNCHWYEISLHYDMILTVLGEPLRHYITTTRTTINVVFTSWLHRAAVYQTTYKDDIFQSIADTTVRFRHSFKCFLQRFNSVFFPFLIISNGSIPFTVFLTPFWFAFHPLSSRKLLIVTHRRSCLKVRKIKQHMFDKWYTY